MKPPAFQFYPADFIFGTMGMTDEEVGVYVKMLCLQWDRGSLPNCPKAIKKSISSRRVPSEVVLSKFEKLSDGSLQNARLEKERQKQAEFRESRAKNAKSRWEKPRDKQEDKQCTSNARAQSSTCKTDALLSSSSSSLEDALSTRAREADRRSRNTAPTPRNANAPPAETPEGEIEPPRGMPRTETEARETAAFAGVTPEFALTAWHMAKGRGWQDAKGIPIRNWQSHLKANWTFAQDRLAREKANETNRRNNQSGNERNQWASRADEYENL